MRDEKTTTTTRRQKSEKGNKKGTGRENAEGAEEQEDSRSRRTRRQKTEDRRQKSKKKKTDRRATHHPGGSICWVGSEALYSGQWLASPIGGQPEHQCERVNSPLPYLCGQCRGSDKNSSVWSVQGAGQFLAMQSSSDKNNSMHARSKATQVVFGSAFAGSGDTAQHSAAQHRAAV
eukprot:COSAG06_NODE_3361_length_5453_cov_8.336758_7_plen_176_part_00